MSTPCVITFEGDVFHAHVIELTEAEYNAIMLGADHDVILEWKRKLQNRNTFSGFTFAAHGAHFTTYVGDDPYLPIVQEFDAAARTPAASFVRRPDITPMGKSFIVYEKYTSQARYEYCAPAPFRAEALTLSSSTRLLPDGKLVTLITPLYEDAPFTALDEWIEREEFYLVARTGEQFNLHFA